MRSRMMAKRCLAKMPYCGTTDDDDDDEKPEPVFFQTYKVVWL